MLPKINLPTVDTGPLYYGDREDPPPVDHPGRRSLIAFTEYTFKRYVTEDAHRLIAQHLDRIVSGDLKRLMIFAPPQHGKSQLASVQLPAYWLGRHPDDPVAIASYGAQLSYDKSRQVRDIIEGPFYGDLFPSITTRKDSRAVDFWHLQGHRGGLWAGGVGGPITGHGFRLGIIDDPFKSWEEAQSETIRERVWSWFLNTFRTRIWEDGAIVLIMSRWHEDDLAGRLLQAQGDKWEVLRLPALAETQENRDKANERLGLVEGMPDPLEREPGEALCPERFSAEALQEIRRDLGSLSWNAEYGGSPTAPEGDRFKREWFSQFVNTVPKGCEFVRYWDKAASKDAGAYSSGVLMAKDAKKRFYVADVVRGQWSSLEREDIIKQTAELDRQQYGHVTIWHEQEPGSGGKESAESTNRNLAGYDAHFETVTGDKDTRLEPFRAQCEAMNIWLVRGQWNRTYIDEMVAIPNGKYRDQGDGSSGAFNKLALPEEKKKASVF